MADLCLLDENGVVAQRWAVGSQPMAVGRGENAEVTIPDDALSRRHFLIWQEGEGYLIEDLDSQNGTWVDGRRTKIARLRHDVCIVAGRSVFMFSSHVPATASGLKPFAAASDAALVLPAATLRQAASLGARPTSPLG